VRTPEVTARLIAIAGTRRTITDAAVTSAILARLALMVEVGDMPASIVRAWEILAFDLYMERRRRGGELEHEGHGARGAEAASPNG